MPVLMKADHFPASSFQTGYFCKRWIADSITVVAENANHNSFDSGGSVNLTFTKIFGQENSHCGALLYQKNSLFRATIQFSSSPVQFYISGVLVQSCNHYSVLHINDPLLVAPLTWSKFSFTAVIQCDNALQANLTKTV